MGYIISLYLFYMITELKGIIKYIEQMYKPEKIWIDKSNNHNSDEIVINLSFNEIGDEYITNHNFYSKNKMKEMNLEKQIRKDIYDYFGVMTSGLNLQGFAPYEYHGLTIDVHLN